MKQLLLASVLLAISSCSSTQLDTAVDVATIGGAAAAGAAVAGPPGAAGAAILGDLFTENGAQQEEIKKLEEKVNELQTGTVPIPEHYTPMYYIKLAGQWLLLFFVLIIAFKVWRANK